MRILGIETSCDETAVAVIARVGDGAPRILYEEVASQAKLHEEYGGVVPELASREHMATLPILVERALAALAVSSAELDAIAVTVGPGLKGCLLIGVDFAKGFALARKLPLFGVHHIEGHVLAAALSVGEYILRDGAPTLVLIVSGGHTELLYFEQFGRYRCVARTLDDAAGEAFDKAANLIGLAYPGGPRLAALADSVSATEFTLPRIMPGESNFSFSGLKTAIALLVRSQGEGARNPQTQAALARAVQDAIVSELVSKVRAALKSTGAARLIIGGGVAANSALRLALANLPGIELCLPAPKHCVDNGAMIAYAGLMRMERGAIPSLELDVSPRLPLEDLYGAQ